MTRGYSALPGVRTLTERIKHQCGSDQTAFAQFLMGFVEFVVCAGRR